MEKTNLRDTIDTKTSQDYQNKEVISIESAESTISELELDSSISVENLLDENGCSRTSSKSDHGSECSKDVTGSTSSDEPRQIYFRPLLAVQNEAHQSYMQKRHNNFYMPVLNSQRRLPNSDWINICRICHGSESTGDLLSPCKCKGSIALAHIHCLERWLKESATSHCELCRYHYTIIRQPKYGILKSIFVFIRHPGDRLLEMVCDFIGFIVYTSTTIVSTYTLSVICESITKTSTSARTISSQIVGFSAVLGIAIIDFTYTSWLLSNVDKHTLAWQTWYRNNCDLKVILSHDKLSIKCDRDDTEQEETHLETELC